MSDPRECIFTTDPFASEDYDPHSIDVSDYVHLAPTGADTREILYALTDNPEVLPREADEKLDDICFGGNKFFRTTPEQDLACELAIKINAQIDNYWQSIVSHNIKMPNGKAQGSMLSPAEKTTPRILN